MKKIIESPALRGAYVHSLVLWSKWVAPVIVSLCALSLCACRNMSEHVRIDIQAVLNAELPEGFTGHTVFHHKNALFTLDVYAAGIEKKNGVWTWKILRYKREDRWSEGWITLAPGDAVDGAPSFPTSPAFPAG